MAMLLVVATTEATDPTRESGPFPLIANVSEFSSKRVRDETDGVTEEERVGAIQTTSHHHMEPAKPMEPIGSISLGEGGNCIMAKKKAAKKPAKKAAKKTSKKK